MTITTQQQQWTEQEGSVIVGVPYVKNTFLCVGPPAQQAATPKRSASVSPRGSSDGFARQLHALMYRPTPVRQRPVLAEQKPEQQEKKVCRFAESELAGTTAAPAGPFGSPAGPALQLLRAGSSSGDSSTDFGELLAAWPPSSQGSPFASEAGGEELDAAVTPMEKERERRIDAAIPMLPKVVSAAKLVPLPSVGSAGHEEGSCKPCVFAFSEKKACENGKQCPFCHFPHEPKKRVRLCKKKRMELKARQQEEDMQRTGEEGFEEFDE